MGAPQWTQKAEPAICFSPQAPQYAAPIPAGQPQTGQPAVTEGDNGKFLRVAGGGWAAEAVASAEEASF